MKDYNEITKDLLERRDRYFADKKIKRKKAISIVVPVCCVSIISLLALGVLRGDNLKDTIQLSTTEQNQSEHHGKNESAKVEVDDNDVTESTKPNKGNKGNKGDRPNNKNPNKPEDELIVTENFSEMAPDYNSDLSSGRLPNKDHSNNKDHDMNFTQGETENPDADKQIMKIVVTQMPAKTVYYLGDTFDFRGLEVTGYFSTGDVEDITPYVQIYNTVAAGVSNRYDIYLEYTDNSEGINVAFTEFYVQVLEPNIDISKQSMTLGIGETQNISAITEATGCNITWRSTDTSVVTVDGNGNVTAVGEGTASVYAEISLHNFKKASSYCAVTVN